LLLMPAMAAAGEPVDLDEVMCALCHFAPADDFAASVHYQSGLLLCSDCHGGLPFEADPKVAKAEGTDYIGRPGRGEIARVCSKCHPASADFFAQGPHGDWQHADSPTCVTCHHNHQVLDASLALMDETCAECHQAGTSALERGEDIRTAVTQGKERIVRLQALVDGLLAEDRSLRRARPFLESAGGALRGAEPGTHALDPGIIGEKLDESGQELDEVQRLVEAHFEGRKRRRWAVGVVWVFALGNVALLWWKRRQLE